jgi:hypothetical protein
MKIKMNNTLAQLEQRITQLESVVLSLNAVAGLSPEIQRTISLILEKPSDKTVASGSQAVNEAGSSAYNVMKAPSGFISIGGKNVPYID